MLNLYLNAILRSKEKQVLVQPSDHFIKKSPPFFLVSFLIQPKQLYFQVFMENEKYIVTADSFNLLIDKYYYLYEEFNKRLSEEQILFIDATIQMNFPVFYLNKDYVEIQDIVECCKRYAVLNGEKEFSLFLNKDQPILINGDLLDVSMIINNPDNHAMENHINAIKETALDGKQIITMFILHHWVEQEKRKNPKYPKTIKEFMVPVENGKYYMTNKELEEELLSDAISSLNLKEYLKNIYNEGYSVFLINMLKENPFGFWKF